MWYYVPETPPHVTDNDITELSLYTGNSGFGLLARLLFPDIRTATDLGMNTRFEGVYA